MKMSIILWLISSALSFNSFAAGAECLAGGQTLNINNQVIIQWKSTTRNQYRNRAHIQGVLIKNYPDKTGHDHFEVQIGSNPTDTVEVIYNEEFGTIPEVKAGARFEACGDYITSNATSGGYPASPDGAIVHWVHQSPDPGRHDSGFLMINGVLYGQNADGAGPKHHH